MSLNAFPYNYRGNIGVTFGSTTCASRRRRLPRRSYSRRGLDELDEHRRRPLGRVRGAVLPTVVLNDKSHHVPRAPHNTTRYTTNELAEPCRPRPPRPATASRLGSYDHIRHREQGRKLAFQVIELLRGTVRVGIDIDAFRRRPARGQRLPLRRVARLPLVILGGWALDDGPVPGHPEASTPSRNPAVVHVRWAHNACRLFLECSPTRTRAEWPVFMPPTVENAWHADLLLPVALLAPARRSKVTDALAPHWSTGSQTAATVQMPAHRCRSTGEVVL